MNGYSAMREAMIWLQTSEQAKVQLVYWPETNKKEKYYSSPIITQEENGFTAHLLANELEPGIKYNYTVLINSDAIEFSYPLHFESQPLWQYRTDPPTFKAVIGSCAYINESKYDRPGKPYGSHYQIFNSINSTNANMMLWLGDNIYLREADYDSKGGIYKRYSHVRSLPELQPLMSNMHHYAIWDDHDFGPNDADRSYHLKNASLQAFKDFWANPSYGINNSPGITSKFNYYDIDFFLLDNRYNRTSINRVSGDKYILGDEQVDWLIDQLKFSKSPFKMVCIGGQFLSDAAVHENHARFNAEREKIIELIFEENITGVIFLTGDRHHTELSLVERDGNIIYDLTVSPLTSGVHFDNDEINNNRVENTVVQQHNYGLLEFSGEYGKRNLKINIHNADGILQWSKDIPQP